MKKWLLMLLMGVLLAGCGTGDAEGDGGNTTTGDGGSNGNGQEEDANESGEVAGELVPSISETGDLVFQYKVKNESDEEVKLEFSSGQRYDFAVETADGQQRFLYSSVAMFMQVEGEEILAPGDELVYDLDLKEHQLDTDLEAGDYLLKAWITTKDGNKFDVELEFSVE